MALEQCEVRARFASRVPGDELAYAVVDRHVLLTKAAAPAPRGTPFEDPFATFRECDTPGDEAAFGDL